MVPCYPCLFFNKYITTAQTFNGPSDFTTLSSPSSLTTPIMHLRTFNRSSLFLYVYIFLCGSHRIWCKLSLTSLWNIPCLEHKCQSSTTLLQTFSLAISLSRSSETMCIVTKAGPSPTQAVLYLPCSQPFLSFSSPKKAWRYPNVWSRIDLGHN